MGRQNDFRRVRTCQNFCDLFGRETADGLDSAFLGFVNSKVDEVALKILKK